MSLRLGYFLQSYTLFFIPNVFYQIVFQQIIQLESEHCKNIFVLIASAKNNTHIYDSSPPKIHLIGNEAVGFC